jgi:hypothetical protein
MRLSSGQSAVRKKSALHHLIPKVCRNNLLTDSDPPLAGFFMPVAAMAKSLPPFCRHQA